MVINSRRARRTALKYLLAFLASAVGSRTFAKEKPRLPYSSRLEDLSAPAIAGRGKPETGVVVGPQVAPHSLPLHSFPRSGCCVGPRCHFHY